MKKVLVAIIIMVLMVVVFTSCTQDAVANYPLTVGGSLVEQQPTKVVSLSPAVTSVLISLNERDILVGVNDFTPDLLSTDSLAQCGTIAQPDIEKIVDLEADVVITLGDMSPTDANTLYQAGITTVSLTAPKSSLELEMFYTDVAMTLYGEIDGIYEGGNLYRNFTEKIGYLYSKLPEGTKSSYLYIISTAGNVVTGDALESQIFLTTGLENSAQSYTNFVVTEEDLETLDPDFIICDKSISAEDLASSMFKDIPAVVAGSTVYVDTVNFELYSTEIYYDIYHIMQYLHSTVFESSTVTKDIGQLDYYAQNYQYTKPEVDATE